MKRNFVYRTAGRLCDPPAPSLHSTAETTRTITPTKRPRSPDSDSDDGYLDKLGTAALEVFELTQQSRDNVPYPASHVMVSDLHSTPIVSGAITLAVSPLESERIVVMEGENKILRLEKDRLRTELDKLHHQMLQERQLCMAEQKEAEQKFMKETTSLRTTLTFQDQEIQSLQDKCRFLEAGRAPSERRRSLSATSSKLPHSSDGFQAELPQSKADFPSSERFMQSSQVPGTSCSSASKLTSTAISPNLPACSQENEGASQQGMEVEEEELRVLDMPPEEMTGPQILRILMHPDLLNIPDPRCKSLLQESNLTIPPSPKPMKPASLLSLLQAPLSPDRGLRLVSVSAPCSPIAMTPVSARNTSVAKGSLSLGRKPRLACTPTRVDFSRLPISSDSDASFNSVPNPTENAAIEVEKSLSVSSTEAGSICNSHESNSRSTPSLSLQQSFASLLKSTDTLPPSLHPLKMPHFSFESLGKVSRYELNPAAPDSGVSLLPMLESIVTTYYNDQLAAHCSSSTDNSSTITMDHSSEMVDEDMFASPQSSSFSSLTTISMTGTMASPRSQRQKEHVLQAISALETLARYSRQVREVLLWKPLEFVLDNSRQGSSTLTDGPAEPNTDSMNECDMEVDDCVASSTMPERTETPQAGQVFSMPQQESINGWKGQPLFSCGGTLSSKTLSTRKKQTQHKQDFLTPMESLNPPCTCRSMSPDRLLQTLLDLSVASWNQHLDITTSILETLTCVAYQCSEDSVERLSSLIKENGLVMLLGKESAELIKTVISLLTVVCQHSSVVKLLCNDTKLCLLGNCYELFVHPPPSTALQRTDIYLQLTRMISQICELEMGPSVLFESDCCSYELLKKLMSALVEVLQELEVVRQREGAAGVCSQPAEDNGSLFRLAAEEMFFLLRSISLKDRYFADHKGECEHEYTYCVNMAFQLLRDTAVPGEVLQELMDSDSD